MGWIQLYHLLAPLTHFLARFARALRCALSFAPSLAHLLGAHGKEIYVNELNASISYGFNTKWDCPKRNCLKFGMDALWIKPFSSMRVLQIFVPI